MPKLTVEQLRDVALRYRTSKDSLASAPEGAFTGVPEPLYVQRVARAKGLGVGAEAAARAARRWAELEARSVELPPGLERIFGTRDLVPVAFFGRGTVAARSVGRVVHPRPNRREPIGTGFLVGPELVLSNHHVFERPEVAETFALELDYEEEAPQSQLFALRPRVLFLADKTLDYALVAVERISDRGRPLSDYGFLSLHRRTDLIADREPVIVIQHPRGERKQVVVRNNDVELVVEDVIHYQADTEPGSSGSPVFNVDFELVALHRSGVPATHGDDILLIDGTPWDHTEEKRDQIKWVSNEGARIERVASQLAARAAEVADPAGRALLDSLIASLAAPSSPAPPTPSVPERTTTASLPVRSGTVPQTLSKPPSVPEKPAMPEPKIEAPLAVVDAHVVRVQVPIDISIRVGAVRVEAGASPGSTVVAPVASAAPTGVFGEMASERFVLDESYEDRPGYDEDFLGTRVPLPTLTPAAMKNVSRYEDPDGKSQHVLRYHHFSLVMNQKRRMTYFTACNTTRDLALRGKMSRTALNGGGGDKWILDPRIPAGHQIETKELYGPLIFDRGHVVRREDVYWGTSPKLAEYANFDSFHYTNCTPQHPEFNQAQKGEGLWGRLEDHIAKEAAKGTNISYFAGPIFRANDRVMRGVKIPTAFFKVVVAVDDDGNLGAWAFRLSQSRLVAGADEALFTPGEFEHYLLPIERLETMVDVRFPDVVKQADMVSAGAEERLLPDVASIPTRSRQ